MSVSGTNLSSNVVNNQGDAQNDYGVFVDANNNILPPILNQIEPPSMRIPFPPGQYPVVMSQASTEDIIDVGLSSLNAMLGALNGMIAFVTERSSNLNKGVLQTLNQLAVMLPNAINMLTQIQTSKYPASNYPLLINGVLDDISTMGAYVDASVVGNATGGAPFNDSGKSSFSLTDVNNVANTIKTNNLLMQDGNKMDSAKSTISPTDFPMNGATQMNNLVSSNTTPNIFTLIQAVLYLGSSDDASKLVPDIMALGSQFYTNYETIASNTSISYDQFLEQNNYANNDIIPGAVSDIARALNNIINDTK